MDWGISYNLNRTPTRQQVNHKDNGGYYQKEMNRSTTNLGDEPK
jgi:hypothetical protein